MQSMKGMACDGRLLLDINVVDAGQLLAACGELNGRMSPECSRELSLQHADDPPFPLPFPGKYLLVRDANKPQLRLYHVPADAGNVLEAGGEAAEGDEGEAPEGDDE